MKNYTRYFALSLLILSTAASHAALQNGKVQVAVTKGDSSLTNPKLIKETVVTGKLFEQGYKVETTKDSTVELCLSNGSTLLLNPETLIEVRTFRQVASDLIVEGAYQKLDKEPSPSVVEIQVVKGKIIGEVRKLNPQSSFTIKTPAGVARIRGTVYSVEYSENQSARMGNMEVACVKGSVEVTVSGSNSGPSPVEPGKKMNARAPIIIEDSKPLVATEPVKVVLSTPVVNSQQLELPSTEGLLVGSEIKSPGISDGVKIEKVEDGKVKLNTPVTIAAGSEIIFNPPPEATSTSNEDQRKKARVIEDIVSKNVIKLEDSKSLSPGMKLRAAGFPDEVVVVSVDYSTHEVVLSVPVSVSAGTAIVPVAETKLPPVITPPVVTFTPLDQAEIKKISSDIAAGTSLPPKLKEEVQTIANNTPPAKPPVTTDTKTDSTKTEDTKTDSTKTEETKPTTDNTDTTTKPPSTTPTGPVNTGVDQVIDSINKTIQETIEKENQKNPSPTQ